MNTQANQRSGGSQLSTKLQWWADLGQQVATIGLFLYSAFAPHSIAAAEISLAIVGAGWIVRTISTGKTGFRRTRFDLPIWLFFLWTAASSFLSQEPAMSIAKIQSTCVIFLFYLTQATVTRRIVTHLIAVMILSGTVGTLYSVYDLARGRGVVVETLAPDSPLRPLHVREGDAVWRIGGRRVYSVTDIDEEIKNYPAQEEMIVSLIAHGEHVERRGLTVTEAIQSRPSPSGIVGAGPTHRFRASGWTRHYETYSEILQILAQMAFGLALANFRNHGFNLRSKLAFAASLLLAFGIAFTAMRTVLIALAIGFCVICVRALERRAKVVSLAAVLMLIVLALGAFAVYRTRAHDALWLKDPSSTLRAQVVKVGISRIMLHPVFGHGMDAMHAHWTEWGFPGTDMLHLHSTPLQLAFDRGLPALFFWLWIMALFWMTASRGEKSLRDSSDTNRFGILLGATGALAGFFASSLVNYNFGDGEVALVFWWLLGILVMLSTGRTVRVVS